MISESKLEKAGSIKKLLVSASNGRKFYVTDMTKDYHSQFGFIKAEDLSKEPGTVLQTNMGHSFLLLEPNFHDCYERMLRAPQIIPQKDVGFIIARCGINRDSVIVDAGTGSGALAIALGSIAKKVYTYEKREDHLKVAKKNIELIGLDNVEAGLHDIYLSAPVKDVDIVTLDVPEPWEAIASANACLKIGGFIVSYSPCIPQVSDFVEAVKKMECLQFLETIELIERQWEVDGRKIRPKSRSINHSGFLTFVRKVKEKEK